MRRAGSSDLDDRPPRGRNAYLRPLASLLPFLTITNSHRDVIVLMEVVLHEPPRGAPDGDHDEIQATPGWWQPQ
jgi:hypothetical protein